MGYLVCENCKEEFELNPGENKENFDDECNECRGKLKYVEIVQMSRNEIRSRQTGKTKRISKAEKRSRNQFAVIDPHDGGIQIKISSSGSWRGIFNYGGGSNSISGSGNYILYLPDNVGIVVANVQKKSIFGSNLTLSLIKDGREIISRTAHGTHGIAMVKYNFRATSNKKPNLGLDELEKLAELRDKGIITKEEFQAKKKQILGL